ncbi:hypothetical protein F1978_01025 [Vreelandella piezotolerans]|uniref:Uncharacterized protein n=1 Tax=Vreelandella piezotolerans TaxID=2609667 RepID=A0ABQ6XD15_9GAMM|nr:hypothetical protein F1978_01025 [Halomonas piezotolerans]
MGSETLCADAAEPSSRLSKMPTMILVIQCCRTHCSRHRPAKGAGD